MGRHNAFWTELSVCPKGLKTSGNSKTKKGMLYLQCNWLNSEKSMFFLHPSCSTDPGGGSDDILLIKASAFPSEASQESRSQPPNAPSLQRRSLPPQRSSPLGKLDCSCGFEQGQNACPTKYTFNVLMIWSFNMKIKVNIERRRGSHESFAAVDCNCCLALHHNRDEIILPHCCVFVLSWCTFQFPLGPLQAMCAISTTHRSQCAPVRHLQTCSCCHKTLHEQDEQQLQLVVTVGHCTFISIFKFHFIDFCSIRNTFLKAWSDT